MPVRAAAAYASMPPILAPTSTSGLGSADFAARTRSATQSTQSEYRIPRGDGTPVWP